MNGMGADYWREMAPVTLTPDFIADNLGSDVKFYARVLDSFKHPSGGHFHPSLFGLNLWLPESALQLTAYSIVATNLGGTVLVTSKSNLEAVLQLESLISSEPNAFGIFGGKLALFGNSVPYGGLGMWLRYVNLPNGLGVVYLFNGEVPLASE